MSNNMNYNPGPPPVGPISQNGPPGPNLQNPAIDLRPMEELLQVPTYGIGDAIVVHPVLACQFKLKIGLFNLVIAISFHGFENDDPHSYIRRTTNLCNVITNFQQKFGETFNEVWHRFKDLLNKCPHYSFSLVHQIDTFYNGLNQLDQDSLNSAAGGNLLTRNTQEALTIIENKSKAQTSRNKPQVSSASESCETCGGLHPYYEYPAVGGFTQGDVYATTGSYNTGGRKWKKNEDFNDEVHITSPSSTAHVPPPGIQPVSPPKPKEDPKPNPHQPKIPYPSRLDKTKLLNKNDVQVSKVLKDLLKGKAKLEELANTPINAEFYAILLNLNKVLKKLRDPKKFLILCVLQDLEVCNSLADSGASINLMPLLIYEKLRIGPLKPTQMILELANRSVTYLMGAELFFEAGRFLLTLAGAEDGSFMVTPFKVLALSVEFDFKIDLIVFGPDTGKVTSCLDFWWNALGLRGLVYPLAPYGKWCRAQFVLWHNRITLVTP
uniref:Reverse transcriptase domain-containing protein n=1 Tax=Tanacetum cinerariifolium TaxID=118510 RepID=A0A699GVM4_TANCI|nr:reverse transcriptase domain-containing protein [Tanacetum cinerariifolium]